MFVFFKFRFAVKKDWLVPKRLRAPRSAVACRLWGEPVLWYC